MSLLYNKQVFRSNIKEDQQKFMQTDKDRQIAQQKQKMNQLNNFSSTQKQQLLSENYSIEHAGDSQIQEENQQCDNKDELQKQAQMGDYNYEDYGQFDEQYQYMMDYSMASYNKRVSSETNTQCRLEDLINIIEKEVKKVIQLTGFDRQWALQYYQACCWKMHLVPNFIDQKQTSHSMIHFVPTNAEVSNLKGSCDICCLEDQVILKNTCGDQYCENCWKEHLTQRMKAFYTDPFPPCMNVQCKLKTSPFILEELKKNDPIFEKLYIKTLCRSYAKGSTSVKMCKGRQGFSCDRCFRVNKLLDILECQTCENLVCARCGEEYHSPSECFDGPNWRKIVETSTNFIQTFNYKICPNCKEGVERSIGCNSIVCKCSHMFCYICGQKWLPHHSQHGVCYRKQEIDTLEAERKRKIQNETDYIDKLQKYKEEIQKYLQKIKKIDKVDIEQLKNSLVQSFKIISNQLNYLQPLKKKLKKALLIGKNYVLLQYFNEKENYVMKAALANLAPLIEPSYDHLVSTLPNLIEAFSDKQNVSMKATQIRKMELNPQEEFAKGKLQMLEITKNFQKYFQV